jgi:hypothetical protein
MVYCFAFVAVVDFGFAQTSSVPHSSSVIADTNSIYSLEFVHQALTRLPNGTLVATFSTNLLGENNYEVYVVSSGDNGSTWGTPVKVSTGQGMDGWACGQGIYGCVIAADSQNHVYVAWTGVNDSSTYFQVWCARWTGLTWETPVRVSQGAEAGVQAFYTSIAVDGNDKVHLVWQANMDGYGSKIFYSQFDGVWSSPVVVSSVGVFDRYPSIAIDFYNNLHVVYTSGSESYGTSGGIYYAKFNGTWQYSVLISSGSDYTNLGGSCIAIDGNNNLHVVWEGTRRDVSSHPQIWYARFVGSWSAPVRISTSAGMASSDQSNPSVAVDSNNRIHAAWTSEKEHAVFYAGCTTNWGLPVQLESAPSACPVFRWSFYPSSNAITTKLDYLFLKNSVLMFNSGLPSMMKNVSTSITPLKLSASVGQSVMFSSETMGGVSPYTYQWYLNGAPAADATLPYWVFKPTASGTYNVWVAVTDSSGFMVQSETATLQATSQALSGIFGYSSPSSQAGGSGALYDAHGARFNIDVEANVASISCLMKALADSNQPYASYNFRFAIYSDNNGVVGNLVAQTETGKISPDQTVFTSNSTSSILPSGGVWKTLNFSSPVHLTPGAYWLMAVHDGRQFVLIHNEVPNDSNQSASSVIGSLNFPNYLNTPIYTFGYVYCIYASWVYEPNTSSPSPTPTLNPTPSSPSPSLQPTPSASVTPQPTLITVSPSPTASLSIANPTPTQAASPHPLTPTPTPMIEQSNSEQGAGKNNIPTVTLVVAGVALASVVFALIMLHKLHKKGVA